MVAWHWTRGNRLGKGGHGEVFTVIHNNPNLPPLAVKSAPVDRAASLFNERDILRKFRGAPGIIQCFGGSVKSPSSVAADVAGGQAIFNLFLEFASDGSLADAIARYRAGMPVRFVRVYTLSLLKALSLIHSNGYTHCDVKPDNALVFSDQGGCLKLADFGLAVKTPNAGDATRRHIRGTVQYMAPELIVDGKLSAAIDIWSLGCTVLQMLTGEMPWSRCKEEGEVIMAIQNGHPEIPDWLTEEVKDFLKRCFVRDPNQRFSAKSLLRHPFITGGVKEEVITSNGNRDLRHQIEQRKKQSQLKATAVAVAAPYFNMLPHQIMQRN
ncbi:Mitogen-activated protein kinase kinase kinase 20 [Linum perenne]